MAIKRTKEQKQHAQEKREQVTQFSYTAKGGAQAKMVQRVAVESTNFITKDLLKTIIVSLLLFGLLVGIYLYVRYN